MTPFWQSPDGAVTIYCGDARDVLPQLPEASVHMAVTSPPYFGLRTYADKRALGNEPTPAEYLARQVEVFAAVRHVLRPDGTLWVNMGDSYANDGMWGGHTGGKHVKALHHTPIGRNKRYTGFAPATAMGMPWRLAFALGDDGWRLRAENIWHKPAPMPSSVNGTSWRRCRVKVKPGNRPRQHMDYSEGREHAVAVDHQPTAQWSDCPGCPKCAATGGYVLRRGSGRTTVAHEPVFMFDLGEACGYFYDTEAAREVAAEPDRQRNDRIGGLRGHEPRHGVQSTMGASTSRNMRSVWTLSPKPSNYEFCGACGVLYVGGERKSIRRSGTKSTCPNCGRTDGWIAHFAAYPRALPERCIRAGTARTCCSTCAAPHAPVVDVRGGTIGRSWHDHDDDAATGNHKARTGHGYTRTVSQYWATCDCKNATLDASVVLDPYGGTGQTALAALALGRRCIMVELSDDYCKLARARIERVLKIDKPTAPANSSALGPLFAKETA
jgi:DNA modification methylase